MAIVAPVQRFQPSLIYASIGKLIVIADYIFRLIQPKLCKNWRNQPSSILLSCHVWLGFGYGRFKVLHKGVVESIKLDDFVIPYKDLTNGDRQNPCLVYYAWSYWTQ